MATKKERKKKQVAHLHVHGKQVNPWLIFFFFLTATDTHALPILLWSINVLFLCKIYLINALFSCTFSLLMISLFPYELFLRINPLFLCKLSLISDALVSCWLSLINSLFFCKWSLTNALFSWKHSLLMDALFLCKFCLPRNTSRSSDIVHAEII